MKTAFYLYSVVHNKLDTASSRIRGDWLIKYWQDAEPIHFGRNYDAIIYQKVYEVRHAKVFKGVKILDVCDPDWLQTKEPFVEMIKEVDAVTCPTENLKRVMEQWVDKPVIVIPDRHDLEYFREKKIHNGRAKEVCWFGYSHNSPPLKSVRKYLTENDLAISIIADQPVILSEQEAGINVHERFTKWNLDTVNKEIIKSDFVIMPGSKAPAHHFKSNNKTIHAHLLNMPVATSVEELERYIDPKNRIEDAGKNLKIAEEQYDVKKSVKEFKELIERLSEQNRVSHK